MQRPYARTFDLIASEYGWTDEVILDLTLTRMRQVRDVVLIRQAAEWRRSVRLEEAKVRQLVSATHAAAGNRRGAAAAAKIQFLPDEAAEKEPPSVSAVSQVFRADPVLPMFSEEEIAARVAELREAG